MSTRDYHKFPSDGNGDVLWRMYSSGDDLSRSREIEFFLVFPSEDSALRFAVFMLRKGFKVSASSYDKRSKYTWQVGIYPVLKPTYVSVSEFESMLENESKTLGGSNDGWGCFEQ